MCKDAIKELAGAVISSVNPTSYGRIRSKLNKQGFSEIAIYTEIAKHCVDNDISPKEMAKETLSFIEGCALNLYHPKTSNDCHFLRGKFFQIRHGNLDKSEAKSPEQKDMFLCNTCFEVKSGKLRSKNKNEKNTCASCKSKKTREYNQKKKRDQMIEQSSVEVEKAMPVSLSSSEAGFKHDAVSEQLSEALSALPETPETPENESQPETIFEPVVETENEPEEQMETLEMSEENNEQPTAEKTNTKLGFGEKVRLTEVMADEDNATISLQCPTESLHLILAAIKSL